MDEIMLCKVCCARQINEEDKNHPFYSGWCQRCRTAYRDGWLSEKLKKTADEIILNQFGKKIKNDT